MLRLTCSSSSSSSSILKIRFNEGRTSADGIRRRIVRLQLDSSSLHFSFAGPSPRSIIYTDPWNFFWLIMPGSRSTFADPTFIFPCGPASGKIDTVSTLFPLPRLLLGGPKERSDLPFRIPESIYPIPNSLQTRILGNLWNASLEEFFRCFSRFDSVSVSIDFTNRCGLSSVDEIRSVCPIVRVVGEGILEIFVFIFATEAAFFVSYTDLSNSDRFGDALRRDSLGIHLSAVFASVFRHGFLIVRGVRARTASLHGCKSARIPIVPPRWII